MSQMRLPCVTPCGFECIYLCVIFSLLIEKSLFLGILLCIPSVPDFLPLSKSIRILRFNTLNLGGVLGQRFLVLAFDFFALPEQRLKEADLNRRRCG